MSLQTDLQVASPHISRPARRGCGCPFVLLLLPLLYYRLYLALRRRRSAKPEVIAHRGGPAYAPENTLAAFRHAIAAGVDWLEMDVQMTRDGALVVIHDETVDRTTNGTGRVADLTLEQIRALDAGDGERVPTFEEVITPGADGLIVDDPIALARILGR